MPAFIRTLIEHRALIMQLAHRQFQQHTRGAVLGIVWWLLSPLLLLSAYTFVFAFVLGLKWGAQTEGGASEFAMRLFCALIIYQVVADVLASSTYQISANVQYVKRIVFPIDILPVITLVISCAGWFFSFIVLLIMTTVFEGPPAPTALLAPILLLPVILLGLGVGWIFSALGVFLPDLRNVVQILLPMLMFLSPVFYPIERLESYFPNIVYVHPLAAVMEQIRASVFEPSALNFGAWFAALIISTAIAWAGHAMFTRLRPLFADVL